MKQEHERKLKMTATVLAVAFVAAALSAGGYKKFTGWRAERARVAAELEAGRQRAEERRRVAEDQKQRTNMLLKRWADKLDKDRGTLGAYNEFKGETEKDAYGNFVRVKYETGDIQQNVLVITNGPDGVADTADDWYEKRSNLSFAGTGRKLKDKVTPEFLK